MRQPIRFILFAVCLCMASTSHAQSAAVATSIKLTVTSADANLVNALAQELVARHYDIALAVTELPSESGAAGDSRITSSATGTRTGRFTAGQVHAAIAQCASYATRADVTCKGEATLSFP